MLPFFFQYLLAWFLNKAIASMMKDELKTQYLGNKREGAELMMDHFKSSSISYAIEMPLSYSNCEEHDYEINWNQV